MGGGSREWGQRERGDDVTTQAARGRCGDHRRDNEGGSKEWEERERNNDAAARAARGRCGNYRRGCEGGFDFRSKKRPKCYPGEPWDIHIRGPMADRPIL